MGAPRRGDRLPSGGFGRRSGRIYDEVGLEVPEITSGRQEKKGP